MGDVPVVAISRGCVVNAIVWTTVDPNGVPYVPSLGVVLCKPGDEVINSRNGIRL